MPVSPIAKYIDAFTGFYTTEAQIVVLDILRMLRGVTDMDKARIIVDDVLTSHGVDLKFRTKFLEGISGAVKTGAGVKTIPDPIALKRWYLENAYSPAGVKFSAEVNQIKFSKYITESVTKSMRIGEAWKMSAQRLSDIGIQRGDVVSAITDLQKHARQAFSLSDDPQSYRAYTNAIRRAQAGVDKLIDPSRSKLRNAYQQVINATKTGSVQATEGALKYAAYFKARYNAERIVKTETARAYGQAFYTDALNDEDVAFIRWELNSGHEIYDICNFNSDADLYGLGAGCYPLNSVPAYPAHPGCMCRLAAVYATTGRVTAHMNSKKAETYIRRLPADKKVDLMGMQGARDFNDNPATWRQQVNNFEAHKPAQATIPVNLLYKKGG
jgi:hypothetical protein